MKSESSPLGEAEVFAAMVMASGFVLGSSEEGDSVSGSISGSVSSSAASSPAFTDPTLTCLHRERYGSSLVRAAAIERYMRKKANRTFKKKIRYESRKVLASNRARVGGRFIKISGQSESF